MPVYHYQAVDANGQVRSGTIQAVDVRSAQNQLRAQGLIVQQMVSVPAPNATRHRPTQPVPAPADNALRDWATSVVAPKTMVQWLTQLQALVQAGYPLSEAFRTVAHRVHDKRLARACAEIGQRASQGESISQAMANHPHLFPQFLIGNLAAGEQGGYLVETLQQLTEYYEQVHRIRAYGKVPMGIIWFALLSTPIVIAGMIGITRSFERFMGGAGSEEFAQNLGVVVSEMARALLQIGAPVLLVSVSFWLALRWLTRNRGLGDSLRLRSPFVTGLAGWERAHSVALFLFHLHRLTQAGLSPASAWELAVNTVPNYEFARTLRSANPLHQGEPLDSLLSRSKLIPPEEVAIVTTGQQTGTVNEALQRLNDYYLNQALHESQRIPRGMFLTGCLLFVVSSGIALVAVYWIWYRVFLSSIQQYYNP